MTSSAAQPKPTVRVEPITTVEDFARFFDVSAEAFGRQAKDGIWKAFSPGWDTPEGRDAAISRLVSRWSSITKNRNGDPNTVFLKATVVRPDPEEEEEAIGGVAIWVQASVVDGHGDAPATDIGTVMDLNALFPGNPTEQEYLRQLDTALHARRIEVINEIATSSSPAAFVLDLCAVDPAFQRLGIATKLVEWGLEEAKRRGGLESLMEASAMGRHVYGKLGFEQEGDEFDYPMDEQFRGRDLPSNIFMRTGRPAP